jgi:general secretion pathway protein G
MKRIVRRHIRGVTLIEVMVVVVILGIIAGGVAAAVFPQLAKAKIRTTLANAREIRRQASSWRSEHTGDDACPTPLVLRQAELLDSDSKLTDAWDTPFRIACQETQTSVISLGPDKKESADDLVVPEPIAMAP